MIHVVVEQTERDIVITAEDASDLSCFVTVIDYEVLCSSAYAATLALSERLCFGSGKAVRFSPSSVSCSRTQPTRIVRPELQRSTWPTLRTRTELQLRIDVTNAMPGAPVTHRTGHAPVAQFSSTPSPSSVYSYRS